MKKNRLKIIIGGEKYTPIHYYTDEFGVIQCTFIKESKKHLINEYVRLHALKQIGQVINVPNEFLD